MTCPLALSVLPTATSWRMLQMLYFLPSCSIIYDYTVLRSCSDLFRQQTFFFFFVIIVYWKYIYLLIGRRNMKLVCSVCQRRCCVKQWDEWLNFQHTHSLLRLNPVPVVGNWVRYQSTTQLRFTANDSRPLQGETEAVKKRSNCIGQAVIYCRRTLQFSVNRSISSRYSRSRFHCCMSKICVLSCFDLWPAYDCVL